MENAPSDPGLDALLRMTHDEREHFFEQLFEYHQSYPELGDAFISDLGFVPAPDNPNLITQAQMREFLERTGEVGGNSETIIEISLGIILTTKYGYLQGLEPREFLRNMSDFENRFLQRDLINVLFYSFMQRKAEEASARAAEQMNCATAPIFRLPEELIVEIFRACKENSKEPDRPSIQNVRLTCRGFRNMSGDLLLNEIHVYNTSQSLQRLEDISNHPVIRKGVVRVIYHMDYYGPGLANDERLFARYAQDALKSAIKRWELKCQYKSKQVQLEGIPRAMGLATSDFQRALSTVEQMQDRYSMWKCYWNNAIWHAQRLSSLWGDIVDAGFDHSNPEHVRPREAYEEYRSLYALHEDIQPQAITTIATAMARMPLARELHIRDGNDARYSDHEDFDHAALGIEDNVPFARLGSYYNSHDIFYLKLVAPILCWEAGERVNAGPAPADMLVPLLVAIHEAGVRLKDLSIQVSFSSALFQGLWMTDAHREGVEGAVRDLECFHMRVIPPVNDHLAPVVPAQQYEVLRDALSTLVSSKRMKKISLDFEGLGNRERPPTADISCPMVSHEWPNLKQYDFCGPFRMNELEEILSDFTGGEVCLRVDGYLVSGNWEDLLDSLRGRMSKGSSVASRFARVEKWTGGAEWDTMRRRDKKYVFWALQYSPSDENGDGIVNRATAYVMGRHKWNPIREVNDARWTEPQPSSAPNVEDSTSNPASDNDVESDPGEASGSVMDEDESE